MWSKTCLLLQRAYRFSVNILRLPGRLEDVLQRRGLENVLKTSSKTPSRRLGRRKVVRLKTYSRCLEDKSWRRLEDALKTCLQEVLKTLSRQTKYLLGISVSNKSKCVSNKSIFHKSISDNSKANRKCLN